MDVASAQLGLLCNGLGTIHVHNTTLLCSSFNVSMTSHRYYYANEFLLY